MDLKIKKYYVSGGTPGGGTDDEQGGGSSASREIKLTIDSKFRRETSNFKMNFDASNVDPESEAPVLIKYIEKNLKPEELLGLVVSSSVSAPNRPTVGGANAIISVHVTTEELDSDLVYYELYTLDSNPFYYVPSTGALSMNAPYVEEEEGGETGERVIDLTNLEYQKDSKNIETWSGYEAGLGVDDFEGAKVITQAGTQDVTNVVDWPIGETTGFTIKLTIGDTDELTYNPSTGQFRRTPMN